MDVITHGNLFYSNTYVYITERFNGLIQMLLLMRRTQLHPDACLSFCHHREKEANHINTFLQQLAAKFCATTASYSMIGTIGWSPGLISKPASVIFLRKYLVLYSSLSRNSVVSLNMSSTAIEAPTIDWSKCIGKQIWTGALPQHVNHFFSSAGKTT